MRCSFKPEKQAVFETMVKEIYPYNTLERLKI